MFGVCKLIDLMVPDIPESLDIKVKRERYLAKEALQVNKLYYIYVLELRRASDPFVTLGHSGPQHRFSKGRLLRYVFRESLFLIPLIKRRSLYESHCTLLANKRRARVHPTVKFAATMSLWPLADFLIN